ncbi:MAG: IS3 family transposase [Gemmatimonadetes bacterium]|nr:IS3 family transposase [Gemmatimonadota bacterium]
MDRYRFVFEHRTLWRVGEMCRVLEVSRSGFYAWQKRRPSRSQQETERLDRAIKRLYQVSRGRSGSPKITRALWAEDWKVSENRVAKRMKTMGLRSIVRRRFRVTTQSKHAFPVAPNRLGRCFQVDAPNRVWVERYCLYPFAARVGVSGGLHRSVFASGRRLGSFEVAGSWAGP